MTQTSQQASKRMEASFTPGPWEGAAHQENTAVMPCEGGRRIATIHGEPFAAETKANAALIAAAPELLESLQFMLRDLGCCGKDWEMYQTAIKRAQTAIAKATKGGHHV